jgi:glycosyltransferase involved in cell wall biosynthesis
MPPSLAKRASARVHALGHVPDLLPLLEGSRMTVVPLRYGAGVKGKIVTSLAHGVPVVSTPVGAEGMGLTHDVNVLVADGPEAFAQAVVRLHEDEAVWNRLSQGALAYVRDNLSDAAGRRIMARVLDVEAS